MLVKKIGNKTEKKFLDLLQDKGYWAHLFADKVNGQPCDIVALKNDKAYLIDVKHCETDAFYFSRIETNQITAFKYAEQCGVSNEHLGFALYGERTEKFYWLTWSMVKSGELKRVKIDCLPLVEDKL